MKCHRRRRDLWPLLFLLSNNVANYHKQYILLFSICIANQKINKFEGVLEKVCLYLTSSHFQTKLAFKTDHKENVDMKEDCFENNLISVKIDKSFWQKLIKKNHEEVHL